MDEAAVTRKEDREAALANPAIKATYEKIKAERQAARAEEAAKKAAAEPASDLTAF